MLTAMQIFRIIVVAVALANARLVTSASLFDWLKPLPQPMNAFVGDPMQSQTLSPIAVFHQKIMQHLEEQRSRLRQRRPLFDVFAAEVPPMAGFKEQHNYEPVIRDDDNRQAGNVRDYDIYLLGKRNNKAASSWVRSEHRPLPQTVPHCLPPSIHQ